jgi:putative peptidoglycan lipid II flippase
MDEKKRVTKAAGLMSSGTLISRITGFLRDIVLARIFGATGYTDAFFVAYRIPGLLREIFAEGSISAGYVPVFTETMTKEGREEAKRLAGIVFAFLLSVLLIVCFLGVLLAPSIASVLARGFMDNEEQFSLTIKLIRIMFPFILFISLAALAMGTLNSLRSFFIPALAPAFYNLTLISFALFIAPGLSVPILAIGIGVTAGAAVQYGAQLMALQKKGFGIRPVFQFFHPGLKKMLLLLAPVVLTMGVPQINVLVSNTFSTYLPVGSATYLYFSWRFTHLPVGLFAISTATALLPSLSEQAARGNIHELRNTFSFSLRLMFFITLPAMAGLLVLAKPIVNTLLQRGEFTSADTEGTVYALLFLASGIWALAGLRVVRTVFYSMQDTKTPLKIALLSAFINVVFCLVLMGPLKHGGLALANTIAAVVNFGLLFHFLRVKLGRIDGKNIVISTLKISFASAVMGLVGRSVIQGSIWIESGRTLEKTGILAGSIVFCAFVYFLIMYCMKSEELRYLLQIRKSKV